MMRSVALLAKRRVFIFHILDLRQSFPELLLQ